MYFALIHRIYGDNLMLHTAEVTRYYKRKNNIMRYALKHITHKKYQVEILYRDHDDIQRTEHTINNAYKNSLLTDIITYKAYNNV